MRYETQALLHLAAIVPAFLIGTFQLLRPKGRAAHRWLGRSFLLLMLVATAIALCMPARVGPRVLGHFGWIHGLCVLVLYLVPSAWLAARRGDIRTHRGRMIGLYAGGLLVAGGFALMPGRMLHTWLSGAV